MIVNESVPWLSSMLRIEPPDAHSRKMFMWVSVVSQPRYRTMFGWLSFSSVLISRLSSSMLSCRLARVASSQPTGFSTCSATEMSRQGAGGMIRMCALLEGRQCATALLDNCQQPHALLCCLRYRTHLFHSHELTSVCHAQDHGAERSSAQLVHWLPAPFPL